MKSFEESYSQWRDRAVNFHSDALLSMIFSEIRRLPEEGENLLKAAPWQMLLMVKWICQDEELYAHGSRYVASNQLLDLRNMLWNLEAYFPGDAGVILFMRRLIRPQLAFQKGPSLAFLRDLSFIENDSSASSTSPRFQ